jgi:predicted amidohydrolase YtcJ
VVADGRLAFVGSDAEARARFSGAAEVDLGGRLVTPAFVDAHLHSIQTGLVMTGLDLSATPDREALLEGLAGYVATHPEARVVVGHGWDERSWPDPRPPVRPEIDRAAGGVPVYLARVDVHSALVSSALLDELPPLAGLPGWTGDGPLSRDAHHACRGRLAELITDQDRRAAARSALGAAAALGVAAVHELGGPHLGPLTDLTSVREVGEELGLTVVTYWAELAGNEAAARARLVGAAGLAGDLCIDGSIGSRTAALHEPYADAPGPDQPSCGARYLDDAEIAGHLVACTRAGLQGGFHCIGDDAVAAAVAGLRRAAEILGAPAVRAARHRLEHLEMLAEDDVATLADLGVVASMQPAFDACWGGPDGLYAQRLGRERAGGMNRLGTLQRSGVRLAFGTDAPVTPVAGWETVRAAVMHTQPGERMSLPDAFAAATRGCWQAAGQDRAGTLRPGAVASFAVWNSDASVLTASGLPRLDDGEPAPACLATVSCGRVVHAHQDGPLTGS